MSFIKSAATLQQSSPKLVDPKTLEVHLSILKSEIDSIQEYSHGVAAQNFHIKCTDGREFVARCDTRRSIEIAKEDRLFSVLARRKGVVAPKGPWSFSTMDGVTVVLRGHLEGVALPDLATSCWPDGLQLGGMLAQIHGIATPQTARKFFYESAYSAIKQQHKEFLQAIKNLCDIPTVSTLFEVALRRMWAMEASIPLMRQSPTSFIHGDYTPPNFLLDGVNIKVIDWEKACVGPAYSDMAQAIYYFGAAIPRCSVEFASSFLAGYSESSDFSLPALRAWIKYHPVMIFIVDAVSAAKNRALPIEVFNHRREEYFQSVCVPRFKEFLEFEEDVLAQLT